MILVFKIISMIPWWVLPIFVLLVFRGLQAAKPNQSSIFTLPIITGVLFLYFVYKVVNFGPVLTLSLILSHIFLPIFLGMGFGYLFISNKPIAVNKARMAITETGSYWFLAIFMTIFTVKFFFGFLHATNPLLASKLAAIESLAFPGGVLGILLGRTISIWKYYLQAD